MEGEEYVHMVRVSSYHAFIKKYKVIVIIYCNGTEYGVYMY